MAHRASSMEDGEAGGVVDLEAAFASYSRKKRGRVMFTTADKTSVEMRSGEKETPAPLPHLVDNPEELEEPVEPDRVREMLYQAEQDLMKEYEAINEATEGEGEGEGGGDAGDRRHGVSKARTSSEIEPVVEDLSDGDLDEETIFTEAPIIPPELIRRERYLIKKLKEMRDEVLKSHEKGKQMKEKLKAEKAEKEQFRTELLLFQQRNEAQNVHDGNLLFGLDLNLDSKEEYEKNEAHRRKRQQMMMGEILTFDEKEQDLVTLAGNPISFVKMKLMGCFRFWKRFWLKISPLLRDSYFIETHFGAGIGKFFTFFRWMFMVILVLGLVALIAHLDHFYNTSWSSWGSETVPSWLLYSSYGESEAKWYVFFIVFSVLALVYTALRKLVVEDRIKLRAEVQEEADKQRLFSKLIFNCWDHSLVGAQAVQDHRLNVTESIRVLLNEDRIGSVKKNRTRREKAILYTRRIIGNFLVVMLIVATWALLIFLTITQKQLTEDAANSGLESFSTLLVPVAINLINVLFPQLILMITAFERWDNPTFIVKIQLGRLYLLKIATVVLYLFQYYQMLSGQNLQGQLDVESRKDCIENLIGVELCNLLVITFLLEKMFTLFNISLRKLVARKKPSLAKKEFTVSMRVISVIYFQAILWNTIPFVPFITFIGIGLLYLNFKFDKTMIKRFMKVPAKRTSAKDIGVFFTFFYVLTFLLTMTAYYYFFALVRSHNCGPHPDESFMSKLRAYMNEQNWTAFLYSTMFNALFLWFFVLAFIVMFFQQKHKAEIVLRFMHIQKEKFERHVEHMESVIRKQGRDIIRLKVETEEQ
eukprot:TRINITY_DN809_c0_g1_i1.p1 TRINITY_DN809_c0_g1~~TRINITY_DN809_c0_g1_i1.p1  ORF type:complete len:816 (+),score=217.82 TRINITY_DN809_c0_g1_i1:126-2573(+)